MKLVYSGPVPKRLTAEQFMDSIWQLTGTNPTKIEAKVDRAIRDESSAKPKSERLPKPDKITAKWIWGPDPNTKKIKLRKMIAGFQAVFRVFLALRQCFFPPDQREKGDFVQRMDQARLPADRFLFQEEDNLIEVDAEMFGGASGFVAQFILGKDKMPVETDKSWEVAEGKQWKAATEVHPYGRGRKTGFGQRNRVQDRNHSRSRSPHPGGPREERLLMRAGASAPRSGGDRKPAELTTLQAIDLANGQILADYLSRAPGRSKGRKNRPENGSIGSSAMPWPGSLRPRRKHSRGAGVRIRRQPEMEDLLWMVFASQFQIIR